LQNSYTIISLGIKATIKVYLITCDEATFEQFSHNRGVCGAPLYSDFRTWGYQHIKTNLIHVQYQAETAVKVELISSLLYHLALLTSTFTAKIIILHYGANMHSAVRLAAGMVPRRMHAENITLLCACVCSVAAALLSCTYTIACQFFIYRFHESAFAPRGNSRRRRLAPWRAAAARECCRGALAF